MRFQLFLFDADHTLFDFDSSEERCFEHALRDHGIDHPIAPLLTTYRTISRGLWMLFEQGGITQDELKTKRFNDLFTQHEIEADACSVNDAYLSLLPSHPILLDGAVELCREIKKHSRIAIVTNGIEVVQRNRIAASELAPFIDFLVVSEACGYPKPDPRIFDHALTRAEHTDRSTCLMVGDRLEADILGARRAGIRSCWYNPGSLAAKADNLPDYEVRHLLDILEIAKH